MIKTHRRAKLLKAVGFLASSTRFCGVTKLYRLLYLLDFQHFKQTGRSVTGLDYYAWEMGPVPTKLDGELGEPAGDLLDTVRIESGRLLHHRQRLNVVPQRGFKFDRSHFSPREIKLLSDLAREHRDSTAEDMAGITNAKGGPWHMTWQEGQRDNNLIRYDLILETAPDRERVEQAAREYEQTLKRVGAA
jgi:uncharacterized phage-associated protein